MKKAAGFSCDCHLTSRTTAFLVCNTVSVSWKVREQNPEPPSTKKHKANRRLFFTPQVFYSAWKSLEGASVPPGEQILATHLCWDKRELRRSGFHLSHSKTALSHGDSRQPGGREWSGDLVSEQDRKCCHVKTAVCVGKETPYSRRPLSLCARAEGRRRPNNQHLAYPRLVCGIPSEKGQL